jgi:hypothetical protein
MPKNLHLWIILALTLGTMAYMAYKPSTASVASSITVDEDGTVHYGDALLKATWSDAAHSYEGTVAINERQESSPFPMLTNDIVLARGILADFERCKWVSKAGRRYFARCPGVTQASEGTSFDIVTIVPANVEVAKAVEAIEPGQRIRLEGREPRSGRITNQDGMILQVPTRVHILLLDSAEPL